MPRITCKPALCWGSGFFGRLRGFVISEVGAATQLPRLRQRTPAPRPHASGGVDPIFNLVRRFQSFYLAFLQFSGCVLSAIICMDSSVFLWLCLYIMAPCLDLTWCGASRGLQRRAHAHQAKGFAGSILPIFPNSNLDPLSMKTHPPRHIPPFFIWDRMLWILRSMSWDSVDIC